jgi:hypothetical protein
LFIAEVWDIFEDVNISCEEVGVIGNLIGLTVTHSTNPDVSL